MSKHSNEPVWLELRQLPERAGEDVAILRDLLITESVKRPDAETHVRPAGTHLVRVTLDLSVDGPAVATLHVLGANRELVPVRFHCYDLHLGGYALRPSPSGPADGARIRTQLAGEEPGAPRPKLTADEARRLASLLVEYAEEVLD